VNNPERGATFVVSLPLVTGEGAAMSDGGNVAGNEPTKAERSA
jgi:hypothetical protein